MKACFCLKNLVERMNPPVLIKITLVCDARAVVQICSTKLRKSESRIRPHETEDPSHSGISAPKSIIGHFQK